MKSILIFTLLLSGFSASAGWTLRRDIQRINTQVKREIADSFLSATDALDTLMAETLASTYKPVVIKANVHVGSYDWVNDPTCTTANPSVYSNIVIEEFEYLFYYQNQSQQLFKLSGTGFVPEVICDQPGSPTTIKTQRKPRITKL